MKKSVVDMTAKEHSEWFSKKSLTRLTKDDVWGTFDLHTTRFSRRGMLIARGVPKEDDEFFAKVDRDAAIVDMPNVCPIWGDELPYKSVTVVCNSDQFDEVKYWLEFVHGSNCVQDSKFIENGTKIAIRSDYQCW